MDEVSEVHHQTMIKSKNKISNSLTQPIGTIHIQKYIHLCIHTAIHLFHLFMYTSINTSIHPSIIDLFIHPSDPFIRPIIIHPLVYLSIHSFIQSSIHLFIHPSIGSIHSSNHHPSISLSIHPFIHPIIHQYIHPSIYSSIHRIHSFVQSSSTH